MIGQFYNLELEQTVKIKINTSLPIMIKIWLNQEKIRDNIFDFLLSIEQVTANCSLETIQLRRVIEFTAKSIFPSRLNKPLPIEPWALLFNKNLINSLIS